jgi:hypothetical protein
MGKLVYFPFNPVQSSRDPLVTKPILTDREIEPFKERGGPPDGRWSRYFYFI